MRKIFVVVILISLALTTVALAQASELSLTMGDRNGYAMGQERQGWFTLKVSGPDDLAKVVFYLDEQVMGEVTAKPFALRFTTDNYPLGLHKMWAQGFTASGAELRSNEIPAEFVPASKAGKMIFTILGPILAVLVIAMLASAFLGGGKLKNLPAGAERRYGVTGGVICPRCHRPYPVPFMSLNLGLSRMARCPFCGKWSAQRPRPLQELRAAEAAEIKDAKAGAVVEQSEEEKLRKELDDSRYL
jgi:hypothetical protein